MYVLTLARVWAPIRRNARRRVFAGLLAALTILTAVGCTSRSGGRRGLTWQAFSYPTTAVVLIHPTSNQCGAQASTTVTADSVAITVTRHDVPAGHGSCPSPDVAIVKELPNAFGTRTIRAASGSSSGQSYNLADRLHQPVHAATDLPVGASVDGTAPAETWTLTYVNTTASGTTTNIEVRSDPAPTDRQPSNGTVRGRPLIARCDATICWIENQLRYRVDVAGPTDLGNSQRRAVALRFAATLVSG